jgi:hypothetical protein
MDILRKMLLGFLGGLLGTVLILFAWTNISASTVRNRHVVTGWLDKSNFYTQTADIVIENIEKEAKKNGAQGLPFSDPAVKTTVENALSGDFVQTSITSFIDSVYQWLGNSEQDLAFKLDLNPVKTQIVDGLTTYAKARAVNLPKCGAVDGNSPIEPLTTACLPVGVSAEQIGSLAHEYVQGQELFKTPVILGSDLKIKQNGQEVPLTSDGKLQAVRKAYKLGGSLPLILGVSTVVLALGIVFLSKRRIQGLQRVGNIFLTTGFGLLIVYAGLRYFFDWGTKHLASMPGGIDAKQKLTIDVLRVILSDVERLLLIFIIMYFVIGISSRIAAMLLKRRGHGHESPLAQDSPMPVDHTNAPVRDLTPLDPRPVAPTAPTVPRPPRPPRKIQL